MIRGSRFATHAMSGRHDRCCASTSMELRRWHKNCCSRSTLPPHAFCASTTTVFRRWSNPEIMAPDPHHRALTESSPSGASPRHQQPPPPRRRQNHLGHHSSLSRHRRFVAPPRHWSIPHLPPRHQFGPHSHPRVRHRRILAGVMASNILLDPISVYDALTLKFDVDYTSKRCWNWCIWYVETRCWDRCNYIVYIYFVCFYQLVAMLNIVQFQRLLCWDENEVFGMITVHWLNHCNHICERLQQANEHYWNCNFDIGSVEIIAIMFLTVHDVIGSVEISIEIDWWNHCNLRHICTRLLRMKL
jgi:hypothetical protein